ncbi:MAG: phosphohydrolase, partial [Eubacterium sp.]|nr:phosphohydrolase [Eubacterium sp.]
NLPVHLYSRIFTRPMRPSLLNRAFGGPRTDIPTILLSHHPKTIPAAFEWGSDLTLCGHYHGGILRFGKHSGLVSAEMRPFPRDVYGYFQKDGKHAIISSGCGEHDIPLRICNPREIVAVTITA